MASHLPAEDVAFLMDTRQQISLFSLTTKQIEAWLERRFSEVGLATKVVPAEKDLRIKAITTIREQLAAWVVERFHTVYEVPLLVDHVMLALKDELQPDNLLKKLYSRLDQEPKQACLTTWQTLVTEACQAQLQRNTEQLDQWIAAHRPDAYKE